MTWCADNRLLLTEKEWAHVSENCEAKPQNIISITGFQTGNAI